MNKQLIPHELKGTVTIPASKSDGQRALLAAALAPGKSTLIGLGNSDDENAMKKAIHQLGARVTINTEGNTEVEGGIRLQAPISISAGESGLGIRLLTAVCAAFDVPVTLEGHGSLVDRPMRFFEDVLPQFGAKATTKNGKLPITVQGPLSGANATVDGSLSSQFISGCLMALPLASSDSKLIAEQLASVPYVRMTLATLREFGIAIETLPNHTFQIAAPQVYRPTTYRIEADWSSASYFLVAAALGHPVRLQGLSMSSFQADKALLDALLSAGCKIQQLDGTLAVDGTDRHSFEFDATHCPDLFPALVVLAGGTTGVSKISGAERLTHKESNRALTLQQEFGKLGIRIDLDGDIMIVHGTETFSGGKVEAHHDHRIAMALAIAATVATEEVLISGAEAVSKSFPSFWEKLEALGAK